MTHDNPKSNTYSIRERESDQRESAELDDALHDAVQGIAQSLRREESLQREKRNFRVIVTFLLLLIGVFSFLLLDFYTPKETTTNQAIDNAPKASTSLSPSPGSTDNADDTPGDTPHDTVLTTGDFLMKLPRGFEWEVRIIALGERRYRMISKRGLNMLGFYEQQDNRLVMVKPDDERLTEFQWLITNNDHLELVEEPPARKTGAT